MKKYSILQIVAFLVPLYLLLVFSVLSPKEVISQTENRTLTSFPQLSFNTLVSGQFMSELEQYYSDHFAFREPFIRIGQTIDRLSGIPRRDQVVIVSSSGNNMFEEVDYEPRINEIFVGDMFENNSTVTDEIYENVELPNKIQIEEEPLQVQDRDEEEKIDLTDPVSDTVMASQVYDQYLIIGDEAMILYKKNEQAIEEYLQIIHDYREVLDPKVNVYVMVIPTKVEFIQDKKYSKLSDSQSMTLQQLKNGLESSVTFVDVYDTLSEHQGEYIYFRTDHHWTALGAYYGYSEFIQLFGESPTLLEDFNRDQIEGFLGSLYLATLNKELEQNPDTIELYLPKTPHKYHIFWFDHYPLPRKIIDKRYAEKHGNDYAVFLEGDFPWGRIQTNQAENRKLAIIKDSYGNAFVPYLIPHFSEIYIIDPRYFKSEIVKFIEKNDIDHVLFLNNIAVTSHTGYANLLQEKK